MKRGSSDDESTPRPDQKEREVYPDLWERHVQSREGADRALSTERRWGERVIDLGAACAKPAMCSSASNE